MMDYITDACGHYVAKILLENLNEELGTPT
jgi:hypothetical protein